MTRIKFREKIACLLLALLVLPLSSSPGQVPPAPTPTPTPTPDPLPVDPRHQNETVMLKRGNSNILHFHYPAQGDPSYKMPKALVIFTGGGGGWSYWEEKVCDYLRNNGYEVLGLDIHIYAESDYDLDTLQQDFRTLVAYGQKPYGAHPPPVILGGWSSGAEQSVAVAGGPHPPPGLVGLFLVAPGSWAGYGWFGPNALGPRLVTKGTDFTDFAPHLTHLRIVQWHAVLDVVDSRDWLSTLKAPHREYDLANATHDYGEACPEFLTRLNDGLTWIVNGDAEASASAQK